VSKQRVLVLALAALAACGGSAGSAPAAAPGPVTSPRGAVEQFLQAVADSNLQKMASLWGTAAGPAAKTNQPADYQRRLVVMQAYLRNEGIAITSDTPDGAAGPATSPSRRSSVSPASRAKKSAVPSG
jgi:hypothetical protein